MSEEPKRSIQGGLAMKPPSSGNPLQRRPSFLPPARKSSSRAPSCSPKYRRRPSTPPSPSAPSFTFYWASKVIINQHIHSTKFSRVSFHFVSAFRSYETTWNTRFLRGSLFPVHRACLREWLLSVLSRFVRTASCAVPTIRRNAPFRALLLLILLV